MQHLKHVCGRSTRRPLAIQRLTAGVFTLGGMPQTDEQIARMTAHRAVFFMERFLREEKLLGPNEQAALRERLKDKP